MILRPTNIVGKVDALLLRAPSADTLETEPCEHLEATFSGLEGDSHAGFTRRSCVRTRAQYKIGTQIRNVRQATIVSREELGEVAAALGVEELRPEWLGANILLSGIARFTLVPPSSRLIFSSGASLVVDMENEPCRGPAEVIDYHWPGKGKHFPRQAVNRRGVTAWVEREGRISIGEEVALHVPSQPPYPPLQPESKYRSG